MAEQLNEELFPTNIDLQRDGVTMEIAAAVCDIIPDFGIADREVAITGVVTGLIMAGAVEWKPAGRFTRLQRMLGHVVVDGKRLYQKPSRPFERSD